MKYTIIVAVLLLMVSSSNSAVKPEAQETVIHILVVRDSAADVNEITDQLEFLDLTWFNTAFSGQDSTTIAFVAGGDPFDVPGGLSGSLGTQINQVKSFVNFSSGSLPTLRENQAADVVIAFTESLQTAGGSTVCGFAPQDNWIENPQNPSAPEFVDPDNDGLDLRGRDDKDGKIGYYVALVAVGPGCEGVPNWYNAAHEFGHLFGGGHYDLPPEDPGHEWLLPNSRAYG